MMMSKFVAADRAAVGVNVRAEAVFVVISSSAQPEAGTDSSAEYAAAFEASPTLNVAALSLLTRTRESENSGNARAAEFCPQYAPVELPEVHESRQFDCPEARGLLARTPPYIQAWWPPSDMSRA